MNLETEESETEELSEIVELSIVEFFETEESETEEFFETVELSIIEQFVINEFRNRRIRNS